MSFNISAQLLYVKVLLIGIVMETLNKNEKGCCLFLSDLVRMFNVSKFDENDNFLINFAITFLKSTKLKEQIFFDLIKTFKDVNPIKELNKILDYFSKNGNENSNILINIIKH